MSIARLLICICCSLLLCLPAARAHTLEMVFLNPGRQDEPFWSNYVAFMQAAARRLDIRLEVLTAERNHVRQLEQGRAVLARAQRPDYLLVVNEKRVAETLLREAERQQQATLLLHVRLDSEQSHRLGGPRQLLKHWLGEIIADNVASGQLSAQALFERGGEALRRQGRTPRLLVLNGVLATMAAQDRRSGMLTALGLQMPRFAYQEVALDWGQAEAERSVRRLLALQPAINLIWAANNAMAIGAIDAARALGRTPGKDIWIAGAAVGKIGEEAALLRSGELVASIGGQMFNGGWALVLLREHADGRDFAQSGPLRIAVPVTPVLDARNIGQWESALSPESWPALDFTRLLGASCPPAQRFNPAWLQHPGQVC